MIHAIEATGSRLSSFCDAMALEGLSLISHFLPLAVSEPDNLGCGGCWPARVLPALHSQRAWAWCMQFHMIGAEYDTQHGLTNAIVLPPVLHFNLTGQELKCV